MSRRDQNFLVSRALEASSICNSWYTVCKEQFLTVFTQCSKSSRAAGQGARGIAGRRPCYCSPTFPPSASAEPPKTTSQIRTPGHRCHIQTPRHRFRCVLPSYFCLATSSPVVSRPSTSFHSSSRVPRQPQSSFHRAFAENSQHPLPNRESPNTLADKEQRHHVSRGGSH